MEAGLSLQTTTHPLLFLSDSALPLGSFAYSSGLESHLAHTKPSTNTRNTSTAAATSLASFNHFFNLSIASVASTTLPYLHAAYRDPSRLEELDNDLDASTPCIVARRASIAQGRALLGIWERALRNSEAFISSEHDHALLARNKIDSFASSLKSSSGSAYPLNGHLPPLFGAVGAALRVPEPQIAYTYLLNHSKAVLSAAVRASVMGPYQAQAVLASKELQDLIAKCLEREWNVDVDEAGQVAPALDLWIGRHELLYSRIFNS